MDNNNVRFSFYITYILLLTTATITFIEAMRTNIPSVRNVLNLETCVSLVASYFYSVIISKIASSGEKLNWNEISQIRYVDWFITTPMMLLALCLVFSTNNKETIRLGNMVIIILLNFVMLYVGYLGEIKQMTRMTSEVIGFGAFFSMFYIIYDKYIRNSIDIDNKILFGMYFTVWSLYGVAYALNDANKNIMMNVLDAFSKCFIGLGLWVYYTKIIRI